MSITNIQITAYDEINGLSQNGLVEVRLPDGSHWQGQTIEQALSFIRRELAYRTMPYSSIWSARNVHS